MLVLSARDLAKALPMPEAIASQKTAFVAVATGKAESPLRAKLEVPERQATSLFMPARVGAGMGVKIVSVFPGNAVLRQPLTYGAVVMISTVTGAPEALLDGRYLTSLRTGAASGAATDWLARPGARVGVVFGTGAQAETQLAAICAVRALERVAIVGRQPSKLTEFVRRLGPTVSATLQPVASPSARELEKLLGEADVICLATTAREPLFDGLWLSPGAHVNGVGSFTPDAREVDSETVRRAGSVFVDSREAALAEAGDVLIPMREGILDAERLVEVGRLGTEAGAGARAGEVTFFKSVGVAAQDICAAEAAVRTARALGLGTEIEM